MVPNLIIGRDLNFTLSRDEIWGIVAHLDPLNSFFGASSERASFVDVSSVDIRTTWVNNHSKVVDVSERLDRFLLHDYLCVMVDRFKT
jgi:hypothetical protein